MSEVEISYPWLPMAVRAKCCEPEVQLGVERLELFYNHKQVLRGVSFPIYRGCITSVVGPSGCGKTSFLSSLNRLVDLIPGCRMEGRISLDGQDIRQPSCDVKQLRRQVGMIFQKPNPFPLSIWRNLEFPVREHGVTPRKEIPHSIERALRDVGLWEEVKDRLHSPALALSGGQQQRLCIARALILKPKVLLMDEPCSALDPLASATIENLIVSLRGRYSIVIVTHNLAQARRISDHTAFFWFQDGCGQLVEYGTAQQIFTAPAKELTRAYVGGIRG